MAAVEDRDVAMSYCPQATKRAVNANAAQSGYRNKDRAGEFETWAARITLKKTAAIKAYGVMTMAIKKSGWGWSGPEKLDRF